MSDEKQDDKPAVDPAASLGRRSEPTNPRQTVDVSDACIRAAGHIANCPACFAALNALIEEKAFLMLDHGGIQH